MIDSISKKSFWLLVFCAYACMFGQGFIDNTRSVTYPQMRDDLNLNFKQYGSLQSMAQFSYLIWSLAVAMSLQSLGFKIVIVSAFLISICGCLFTSFSNGFWVLFVAQFFMCCGMGALDDAPHAMSSMLFKSNTGVLMLLLHSCYGIGAIVGPAFAGLVNKVLPKYSFRGVSIMMTIPLGLLMIVIMCVKFSIKKPQSDESAKNHTGHTVGTSLISPMVWFQSITLILMTTAERATSAWGGLYLKDVLHLDPAVEGAWFNTCFYIVFTLTRLIGGILVDWIGPFNTEYIVMIIGVVIFTVGLLCGKYGVYILPFAGFSVAFYWPTFIITCMRYWGDDAAIPISCILPMQALLGVGVQYFLGWLNDTFGPRCAYWSTIPCIIMAFACLVAIHLLTLKKEREAKEKDALLECDAMNKITV